jgi:hypothetical protein
MDSPKQFAKNSAKDSNILFLQYTIHLYGAENGDGDRTSEKHLRYLEVNNTICLF